MDLQKELKLKTEELKKMVEQYNQIQRNLEGLGQNILRQDGAIKQLQELINKTKEVK